MKEFFPDGTLIDKWFYDYNKPELNSLGQLYYLSDYNIYDDGKIYTKQIQNLIDKIYANGGGVLVVPKGTFITGTLTFKQGVHLYLSSGAVLKGSDDIRDYQIGKTRIEGETCDYYQALINADSIDGFYIFGNGTIDGNGQKSWESFWLRRKWNPKCTNKDEQRPRLVYLSNCKNVIISDVNLKNSHFWTTHIYKCDHVKYLDCTIYSPASPIKAPSTDAIDIDVCTDVLIKGCYLEVNDDSVVLKGGKGPYAHMDENNGRNERIIIEDCEYGYCHGCLTCGSESIMNKNIIMRRVKVNCGQNLLWLKMRPDTLQTYEYITIDSVIGKVNSFININPWTQFFDLKGEKDILKSKAENITIQNCDCECAIYFNVKKDEAQYSLKNFNFSNLRIKTIKNGYDDNIVDGMIQNNVLIDM